MVSASDCALEQEAARVLAANDRGDYTAPSTIHYPHQWLWDSAYVAIGLSRLDPRRAAREIDSLMAAQWANGMVPHMVFARSQGRRMEPAIGRLLWHARLHPDAPRSLRTSGITQPPVLAEAIWRVGMRLSAAERADFFARNVSKLIRYHGWFYRERDPLASGLVVSVHPWEAGMDNTPPWAHYMRRRHGSAAADFSRRRRVRRTFRRLRNGTAYSGESERVSLEDGLRSISAARALRRWRYGALGPPGPDVPQIQDVAVNSILIRANAVLQLIAAETRTHVPEELQSAMDSASLALMSLWDPESCLFFLRDPRADELLRSPTIACLMPLYTDVLPKPVFAALSAHLRPGAMFDARFPIPSVPLGASDFSDTNYWSGPVWVNMNWNLIDGLERAGACDMAETLVHRTLDMISIGGFREYFSPTTARGLGMPNFSWTAALLLDLVSRYL